MVCVDADRPIPPFNAQTERLFGYGRDELVGQHVEILVPDAVRGIHPGRRAGYVTDPRPRPMGRRWNCRAPPRRSTFPAGISLSASTPGSLIRPRSGMSRSHGPSSGAADAGHQDHRDGGGDAARGVPDDRAEGVRPRPHNVGQHVEILVPTQPRHTPAAGPGIHRPGNPRGAPATRPGRGPPGRPGPARTRSPCPPSTPRKASWSRPRSGMSPTANGPRQGSRGCWRRRRTRWSASTPTGGSRWSTRRPSGCSATAATNWSAST